MNRSPLNPANQPAPTGLVRVHYRYRGGEERSILVKCEHQSLTGTIKDRIVLYILQRARDLGRLNAGEELTDDSGINTALALAAIGKSWGHPVRVFLPAETATEELAMVRHQQAKVELYKVDGRQEIHSHYDGVFAFQPFARRLICEAYERLTGREIGHQCLLQDIRPKAFVSVTHTGAMLNGIGKYLRSLFPAIRLHPVIALQADAIAQKAVDSSLVIQSGISVSVADAIRTARLLGDLGLDIGPFSGANFAAAIRLQQLAGVAEEVITVFPDSGQRYRKTLLGMPGKITADDLSPALELLSFELVTH